MFASRILLGFLSLLFLSSCGSETSKEVDKFCPNGQQSRVLFSTEELGSKEWDGDSYWTQGNADKVRLLGVDFPDIKDKNDLKGCTPESNTQNCRNWYRAFGTLNLEKIENCYWQGLEKIKGLLEGQMICLVEDSQGLTHPFGNLLRYIEFEKDGKVIDYSEWLIREGLAIPWDDKSDYGNCERCDKYQGMPKQGCLWD